MCRGVLWEQEDFRDGGWQRRECVKLGQAVPGNSHQRVAPSTARAKVSISGACLAGCHTLSLLLHLCVCVLSVLPSLAAVIRHRLDFSRTKSQQRPRRWLWGGGTRSPGEQPVGEAPTLLAGLHSSPSAGLNVDATKQVSASSFSEEGRADNFSGYVHVISR